jgi:peptidoglycan glycosyltransferase
MISDSPMMHRVKRKRPFRFLSQLPRKGRIRFILVMFLGVFIVGLGPPFIQRLELPSSASARENDTASSGTLEGAEKNSHVEIFPAADVAQLLLDNPVCLSYNRIAAIFENESLTVVTSTDTALQRYLMKLMDRYHPLYGGLVAIDPHSGRILALVSYVNDSMPDPGGNLCLRALFPAASVFKTITAAVAIESAGYTADCSVEHRGRTSTLYRSQLKAELDGAVDLTFAEVYARSINAAFGRIGIHFLGSVTLIDAAEAFGFTIRLPGDLHCAVSQISAPDSEYILAELASGFNQTTTLTPLHGALIASCIAENGAMPVPSLLDTIVRDRDGAVQHVAEQRTWLRPITPATACELQQMMHAVVKYGTAAKQFRIIRNSRRFDDFMYGGKTGSIDKDGIGRVDWFVGYAVHPQKIDERIAVAVLTVHGAYWTVHSSYLAAEAMRTYLKSRQEQKRLEVVDVPSLPPDALTAVDSTGRTTTQPQ